jgi:hypothetical protein
LSFLSELLERARRESIAVDMPFDPCRIFSMSHDAEVFQRLGEDGGYIPGGMKGVVWRMSMISGVWVERQRRISALQEQTPELHSPFASKVGAWRLQAVDANQGKSLT